MHRGLGITLLELERVGGCVVVGEIVVDVRRRFRLEVLQKLRARTVKRQPALDQHHHFVEDAERGKQVRGNNDCRALIGKLAEEHHHQGFRARVQSRRGLVQKQNPGFGKQLDSDAHSFPLAAAERIDGVIPTLRLELQDVEHLLDTAVDFVFGQVLGQPELCRVV